MRFVSLVLLTVVALIEGDLCRGDLVVQGTKIGIGLGPTPTTNWNDFNANGMLAAGSVKNLAGATLTGVSITVSNVQGFNADGTDNWGGLASNGGSAPPEFVDSVTTDLGFRNTAAAVMTIAINGLDPLLSYNVYATTTAGASPRTDTLTLIGLLTSSSSISRPTTLVAPYPFHQFLNVSTTALGSFTLQVTSPQSNPIINGVLIAAAVPEASAWLLVGVVAVGACAAPRLRRMSASPD